MNICRNSYWVRIVAVVRILFPLENSLVLQMLSGIQASLKSLVEATNKLASAQPTVTGDTSKYIVSVVGSHAYIGMILT